MSDLQPDQALRGRRYINLVRCSSDGQTENSIPAQLELLNAFAATRGMVHVDDVVLDGVSGSKPGNRDDIGRLIERKRERNDFDVLLVQTEDRFTRSGSDHGIWLQYECSRNGIKVVYTSSDAPDGPFAGTFRSFKFEAALETVKSTALRSTQGYQRALESRNVATSSHSPYGTHRLYCAADGNPLFIIRNNRDGTQHKLHHRTREIVETYGEVGHGARGHYRKQKWEKVYLVPGEASEISTVRRIFQRKYLDGVGGRVIAKQLNREGIAAPRGGRWTQRQVDVIAENEVYTGAGIANRVGSGRFYQRSKGQPEAVRLDAQVLAERKTLPVRHRPTEAWVCQDQPHLKDFLPEPLRSIAAEKIRALWTHRCEPGRQKRPYNPHPDSDYLLTGLLTAAQDGRKLKGYTSGGRNGKYLRYYVHPVAQKDAALAGFPNVLIRADVLEQAVLAVVVETLLAMPELKSEVESAVGAALAPQQPLEEIEAERLKKERSALSRRISSILKVIDGDAPEAKAEIAELQRQQREIDLRLREVETITVPSDLDATSLTDSIMERLKNLGQSIGSLPTFQLKQVLAALTDSMTVDMVTRTVSFTVRVPPSALFDAKTAIETLSQRQHSPSSTLSQAQPEPSVIIAKIDCAFSRQQQKQCFQCRRRAA